MGMMDGEPEIQRMPVCEYILTGEYQRFAN